jgi:3-oxoacyl-[acyl-carrier protein] reductase
MSAVSQRFVGRTVLITGAGSGFGAGMASRFAAEGARVVIADINAEAAAEQAALLGEGASWCEMDVSSNASVAAAVEALPEDISVLINNAGIGHTPQNLDSLDEATFDRLFAVNMKSVYLTARHLLPALKRTTGVILNIASTAGVSPRPGLTWYNASKGWMITATRSMAVELATDGIRVNALNPVAGETPLLATFLGEDTPQRRAEFLATIPLGRFSTPADLAAAACYLCSDEASMITGVTLEVDGGRCI